jgi:putative membrane protein
MADPNETTGFKSAVGKAIDTVGGLAGKTAAALTTRPDAFVHSAAIGDMYEIEAGRIARERGQSSEVRAVAENMIEDHSQSTAKLLQAVAESSHVTAADVPAELDMRRQQMLAHLREAPDDRFDRTYIDQQVLAHEETVTLMHHYRREGDCPVLAGFADEVSPTIERHLQHMRLLQSH